MKTIDFIIPTDVAKRLPLRWPLVRFVQDAELEWHWVLYSKRARVIAESGRPFKTERECKQAFAEMQDIVRLNHANEVVVTPYVETVPPLFSEGQRVHFNALGEKTFPNTKNGATAGTVRKVLPDNRLSVLLDGYKTATEYSCNYFAVSE